MGGSSSKADTPFSTQIRVVLNTVFCSPNAIAVLPRELIEIIAGYIPIPVTVKTLYRTKDKSELSSCCFVSPPDGSGDYLLVSEFGSSLLKRFELSTPNGSTAPRYSDVHVTPAPAAALSRPTNCCVVPVDHAILVAEWGDNRLFRIDGRTGQFSVFSSGHLTTPFRDAFNEVRDMGGFAGPSGLCVTPDSRYVYVCGNIDATIRRVDYKTKEVIVVGGCGSGASHDDSDAYMPLGSLREPRSIAMELSPDAGDGEPNSVLYVSCDANRIRRLDLKTGRLSTVPLKINEFALSSIACIAPYTLLAAGHAGVFKIDVRFTPRFVSAADIEARRRPPDWDSLPDMTGFERLTPVAGRYVPRPFFHYIMLDDPSYKPPPPLPPAKDGDASVAAFGPSTTGLCYVPADPSSGRFEARAYVCDGGRLRLVAGSFV